MYGHKRYYSIFYGHSVSYIDSSDLTLIKTCFVSVIIGQVLATKTSRRDSHEGLLNSKNLIHYSVHYKGEGPLHPFKGIWEGGGSVIFTVFK